MIAILSGQMVPTSTAVYRKLSCDITVIKPVHDPACAFRRPSHAPKP
jgi:hypothetical protein